MFAPQHALFVGPGKVPDELRRVTEDSGAEDAPRLLAVFETAAEAERLASQLQRLQLRVAVAGPEQPPAEDGWAQASSIDTEGNAWRVLAGTEAILFGTADVTGLTLLDWRPADGPVDRAILLTLREAKPVMLRASRLDPAPHPSVPVAGLRRLNDFLDAVAPGLSPDVRVRSRQWTMGHDALAKGNDLLPLVLAVVNHLDTAPGSVPLPLQGRRIAAPPQNDRTTLASFCAWVLYVISLPSLILSFAYFTISGVTLGVVTAVIGLALGAWGTRRFMWSRWLARENWGLDNPVPSWPIPSSQPGIAPRPAELTLDALTLTSVCIGALGEGLVRAISLWSLPFILLAVLTSAAAVYEAWQRS